MTGSGFTVYLPEDHLPTTPWSRSPAPPSIEIGIRRPVTEDCIRKIYDYMGNGDDRRHHGLEGALQGAPQPDEIGHALRHGHRPQEPLLPEPPEAPLLPREEDDGEGQGAHRLRDLDGGRLPVLRKVEEKLLGTLSRSLQDGQGPRRRPDRTTHAPAGHRPFRPLSSSSSAFFSAVRDVLHRRQPFALAVQGESRLASGPRWSRRMQARTNESPGHHPHREHPGQRRRLRHRDVPLHERPCPRAGGQAVLVGDRGHDPDHPRLRRDRSQRPSPLRTPSGPATVLAYPVRAPSWSCSTRSVKVLILRDRGCSCPRRAARRLRRPPPAQRGGDSHRPAWPGARGLSGLPPPDRLRRPRHRLPAGQGGHGPAARDQGHRDRAPAARTSWPIVRSSGYSRYPVYRGRLDNIEGIIHGKDIIGYLIDKKELSSQGHPPQGRSSSPSWPRSRRSFSRCRRRPSTWPSSSTSSATSTAW
ncbi:MAG: hypothetical protein MZU95_13280 [Desulfomicrobium escambiense]|nr:hypothetical protein [Desulfomicrobium escambiense]